MFLLSVEILFVVFFVIWLVPLIARKISVPSIILLIIFGVIIGPHGFDIIGIDSRIKMLSDIGIMFIMFLAGIELDINQVKSNKEQSIIFGALVFIIPISVGFAIFYYLLGYALLPSALIALMFSTQTLVSYPIVSRLGLTKNRSVITAVGGTIITDAAVLFSIGIIVTSSKNALTADYLLKFIVLVVGFILIVVIVYPFIVRRYFRNYELSAYSNFSLIMTLLFLAGTIAHFVGLESIIGAFLAGIMLNKYIPKNSNLMENLHFVGNAIFIPIFLFYVGMLIDYHSVINNAETIIVSAILTFSALSAKLFSSWLAGTMFKFSNDEIGLLFGLSSSEAAVVIATALIGYNLGIINTSTLNATVVLIFASCSVSSFVSEFYGKRLVKSAQALYLEQEDSDNKVIVSYANPQTVDKLIDMAIAVTYTSPQSIIYLLSIVMENDAEYKQTIKINEHLIKDLIKKRYSPDINFFPVTRIDMNPVAGISRAVKELMGTMLIVGWTTQPIRSNVLGKKTDFIMENTDVQTMVCHLTKPINFFSEIIVFVPENSQFEKGFKKWMHTIHLMQSNLAAKLTFVCRENVAKILHHYSQDLEISINAKFVIKNSYQEIEEHLNYITPNTLLCFIYARDKSVSENRNVEQFVKTMREYENRVNFVVIVPEQYSTGLMHNYLQNEITDFI